MSVDGKSFVICECLTNSEASCTDGKPCGMWFKGEGDLEASISIHSMSDPRVTSDRSFNLPEPWFLSLEK